MGDHNEQENGKEWTDFHTLKREENEKYTKLLFLAAFLGPLALILIQTLGVRSTAYYPSWMLLIVVVLSFLFYAAARRIFPVDPTIELYLWGCIFAFTAIMGDTVFTPATPCAVSLFYLIYLPLAITDRPVCVWITEGLLSVFALGLDFLSHLRSPLPCRRPHPLRMQSRRERFLQDPQYLLSEKLSGYCSRACHLLADHPVNSNR